MSVNIYSFPINTSEEYHITGINLVNFLGSILDSNIVENINYDVLPDWVSNRLDDIGTAHKILNFSYHNVDFCIICYTHDIVSSAVLVKIVGKSAIGEVISSTIEQITGSSSTLNFLIGQNNDYFLFCCTEMPTYFGVFRIDAPTNADDTNVYISVFDEDRVICYTKPFRNEDISITTYFTSDMPHPGITSYEMAPYEGTFIKNFYNAEIPVYNVYAHTGIYGTRGKLTNLISLPDSYKLSPERFYMVNGDKYCAFGTLGIKHAGTVLVRVK